MTTAEEIDNSRIMRITRKILHNEFPWIKDIKVKHKDQPFMYDTLVFIEAYIDAEQMADDLGMTLRPFVINHIGNPSFNYYSALCTMVEEECSDPKVTSIERNIDRHVLSAVMSPAIPKEYLDVLRGRKLSMGYFIPIKYE